MPEFEVHPVKPERWPDLVGLFEEGGDPKTCWCMFWRVRARDFQMGDSSAKRDRLRERVGGAVPPGLLAYREGRPVGWVGVGPRTEFERLERSAIIPRLDDRPVWSVVCFAVSRQARGRGVGRALLRAAVAHANDSGAPAIEAYPAITDGVRLPAWAAYTGTLPMFEREGFSIVGDTGSKTAGRPRTIVRRELGRGDIDR